MLKRGAIGFSTHKDKPLSRLIRWFTKYKYSHSFVVSDVVKNRVYLLEVEAPQVAFSTLDSYNIPTVEYEIWYPIGMDEAEIDQALRHTERIFLKKKYSWASLVGIAITIIVQKVFGKVIKNPLRMGAWCAEADWHYLSALMPDLFGWMDHSTVSPKDLHMIVSESGRFERVAWSEFSDTK